MCPVATDTRIDQWDARSHLPPPMPGPAPLRQAWVDVAFVHWRVEPDTVARLLPAGTGPDTLDGCTYVGLVAFRVPGTLVLGSVPVAGVTPPPEPPVSVLWASGVSCPITPTLLWQGSSGRPDPRRISQCQRVLSLRNPVRNHEPGR